MDRIFSSENPTPRNPSTFVSLRRRFAGELGDEIQHRSRLVIQVGVLIVVHHVTCHDRII